jgi:hypothetical protein
MAYVPGYDHDVFVSYAHADEAADSSGKWATEFIDRLRGALKHRLGGSEELRIFFDRESLGSNQQLEEMLTAARRSAIFLAIASRSYASRDWTRHELEAFARVSEDTSRLFAIECLPLGDGEFYPSPLRGHHRMTFWRTVSPSNTPVPLSLELDAGAFHQRIYDLAEQIRNRLLVLRKSSSNGGHPTHPNAAPSVERIAPGLANYRRVLLAQVTEDLEDERDELRRYLDQFGVAVVPAATYPQGGDAFKRAFEADLAEAGLLVQLLSTRPGRAPPDLSEGYTRFQRDAAAARGIEIVQWCRPDLDPDTVTNPQHRELLNAETVIATGFEAFKTEVLRRATPAQPKKTPARSSLVFIDADRDDTAIARALEQEFRLHKLSVVVPTLEGTAEELRADLEENIVDCDALVLVYGQTTPIWVRGQLRLYSKLKARRAEPPRVLAVYCGPPQTKPELGFSLPEVREIDCRTALTFEPLRTIIQELIN